MSKYTKLGLEDAVIKLDQKLDLISEKMVSIDKTLERNTESLEEHMKRSDHLESLVNIQEQEFKNELEPIKKHVNMIKGSLKFVTLATSLIGVILGILKIFGLV